uniref:Putative transcription factor tcf20 n=1 Tax=Nyssomyia neivai TaxID=330878 RepID=A0A1L8DHE2_9DIPT
MSEGNGAMSGPHGRLGPNTSWNHLQVPSYIPRQPQLAHLSNERPMTWHTPTPPPTDALYTFMAANHKNPLDLNPLMPNFAPTGSPFSGTMDLTVRNSTSPRTLPSPKSPSVIQSVGKNNGELGGTLFVRDAKQINNDVAKLSAEPVELVKDGIFKNHAPKCNSPVQPPAVPMRQSPAPSVSPPVVNQPNDLSSASLMVSPVNQSEDSVDSSGGRKRRKRKPNKTTRMENEPEEEPEQRLPVPCETPEPPRIVEPPPPVEERDAAGSPGKQMDTSPRRRSRRKGADDAEPVETIDMIANTEEAPDPKPVEKSPENGNKVQEATNANFDEVENKLEQMFAGIDNRPTLTINLTPVVVPSTSKPAPKMARKRALSIDVDLMKPKRQRGRKPGQAKEKAAVKRKKGRPKVKPTPNDAPVAEAPTTPRFRGPYVQVRTSGAMSVINTPQAEDDGDRKGRLYVHANSERRKIRGLHVSTLSTKYDADTTDATWMCVFCKFGPHKMGLGDLFGPYTVSTSCDDFQLSQVEPTMDEFKSKRTKATMVQRKPHCLPVVAAGDAGASTSGGKKKKKQAQDDAVAPDIYAGMGRLSEDTLEVWLHEDCIVWAPGVHIVGARLVGLDTAVWGSTRHICVLCTKNGATLGCLERGCSQMIHLPCARQSNWSLSDEDFKCHCAHHDPEGGARVNGQA